jgi:PUA domain protein
MVRALFFPPSRCLSNSVSRFSHDHIELLVNSAGDQLFFRSREGNWLVCQILHSRTSILMTGFMIYLSRMPTLRLFHKFPVFLPKQQVDKGAIRFVLSGANIMCPGLTSPGAHMNPVEKGTAVAIMAEGKENCLAIGLTTMSTADM